MDLQKTVSHTLDYWKKPFYRSKRQNRCRSKSISRKREREWVNVDKFHFVVALCHTHKTAHIFSCISLQSNGAWIAFLKCLRGFVSVFSPCSLVRLLFCRCFMPFRVFFFPFFFVPVNRHGVERFRQRWCIKRLFYTIKRIHHITQLAKEYKTFTINCALWWKQNQQNFNMMGKNMAE